ncbi:hypothetical protein CBR_g22983 [Chara braunii]|uniref:Uncharacterized protein n=1 Tax=Chara braunii TaxID=69332 RepID=A0A388L392_CHABU|nr:hypothetical protein CBR_g22983 [Chara braunii]|eukprot:GBG76767.1 hypothetical protein CBR_g22983 [Chara braunii]
MDEESKDYCRRTGYREEVRCEPALEVESEEREGDGDGDREGEEGENKVQAMQDPDPETAEGRKPADKSLEPSSVAKKNGTGSEPGDDEKGFVDGEDANNEGPRKRRLRRILAAEEQKVLRSCIPFGDEVDKISVWAFEGIMLATFAVAAPVVRYRRGRSSAPPGMTRLPGSVWF